MFVRIKDTRWAIKLQGGHRYKNENEADQGGDGQMTFTNPKATLWL